MKILNITHNDLDGISCGVLSKIVFGDGAQIHITGNAQPRVLNAFYTDLIDRADEYDYIFITDLNVPLKSAELMNAYNERTKSRKFFVCDHHKNSIELMDFEWCYILSDDKSECFEPQCGTSIYFDMLEVLAGEGCFNLMYDPDEDFWTALDNRYYNGFTDKLRNYVELVRLWDTYQWTQIDDHAKALEAAYLNDLYNVSSMEYMYTLLVNQDALNGGTVQCTTDVLPKNIASFVATMRDNRERIASKRIQKCGYVRYLMISGDDANLVTSEVASDPDKYVGCRRYKTMIMFGNEHISDIKNLLASGNPDLEPDVDIVLIWDIGSKKISIRVSDDCDFNASEFCAARGGGGHVKASGITYGGEPSDNPTELNSDRKMKELLKQLTDVLMSTLE